MCIRDRSNLDEIHNASKDMSRFCEELIDYFRAMMIIRTVKQPEGLLKLPVDQIEKLKILSDRFNLNEIMHIMKCLQRTLDDMSYSSNKRVDMELSLMKAASPELDSSPEALSLSLIHIYMIHHVLSIRITKHIKHLTNKK